MCTNGMRVWAKSELQEIMNAFLNDKYCVILESEMKKLPTKFKFRKNEKKNQI